MKKKNVVVIGGGTGTHTLLRGLKSYQDKIDISAIVTMADSGGSTGRLRDEFGFLPVGDVRMALTALASDVDEQEELLRRLFLYRFDRGEGLSGHNFGNLLLVALTDILGSEDLAIRSAGKILRVAGRVEPVTSEKTNLVALYDDGKRLVGEHNIDEANGVGADGQIVELSLSSKVCITDSAKATLLEADLIVLGPGDLYTSILANCIVEGVCDAIRDSGAKLAYVSNLMTRSGQTNNLTVMGHAEQVEKYIEYKLDFILVNKTSLPTELVEKYQHDQEFPVRCDRGEGDDRVVLSDFLATESIQTDSGDMVKRSLIRHDSHKLAKQIMNLL